MYLSRLYLSRLYLSRLYLSWLCFPEGLVLLGFGGGCFLPDIEAVGGADLAWYFD